MSKLPKPLRRKEYYLDKLAKQSMGEEVTKAMPKPLTRTETYLNALADNAKMLPQVTSEDNGDVLKVIEGAWGKGEIPTELPEVTAEDNGNVLAVVEGAWAKAQPSGGESPIAVFSVTFKNPNTQMQMYEHVYWGANDTTHEIVEGVTDYCAELDAAMAEGKAIMIKAYIDDKMFNLVPTSLSYMSGIYTLINNLGQGSGIYYSALNGAWERFKYTKTASSNKDGSFTADIKLSLT